MSIWFCVVNGQTCLITEDYIGFGDISFIQIKSVLYFEDYDFVARLVDWSNERWAAWPTRGGSCPLWSAGDAGERSDRSGPTVPHHPVSSWPDRRPDAVQRFSTLRQLQSQKSATQSTSAHLQVEAEKNTKFCGSDNAGKLFLQIALILSFCSGTNCIGLEKFWD